MNAEDEKKATALTDSELQRLKEVDSALVAGPWVVWDDGDIGTDYPVEQLHRGRRGEDSTRIVESLWLFNGHSPISDQVVEIRNLLPGLLARLDGAEARIRELEAELEVAGTPF